MIDDDKFHKDNTLFVLEDDLSKEKIKILDRKNYNYIRASYKNPIEKINIQLFFADIQVLSITLFILLFICFQIH